MKWLYLQGDHCFYGAEQISFSYYPCLRVLCCLQRQEVTKYIYSSSVHEHKSFPFIPLSTSTPLHLRESFTDSHFCMQKNERGLKYCVLLQMNSCLILHSAAALCSSSVWNAPVSLRSPLQNTLSPLIGQLTHAWASTTNTNRANPNPCAKSIHTCQTSHWA